MRLNAARIAPLAEADMAPELLALLGPRFKAIPVLNIFRTLAHAPKAFKRFMAWGGYILSDATVAGVLANRNAPKLLSSP